MVRAVKLDLTSREFTSPLSFFDFVAISSRTPGSWIEKKDVSLVWHYDKADMTFG